MATRPQSRWGDLRWFLTSPWRKRALARTLERLRETNSSRSRLYLIDPSYEGDIGHYRSVARCLEEECRQRDWGFVHLSGPLDRQPSEGRLRWFHRFARIPLRVHRPNLPRRGRQRVLRDTRRNLWEFAGELDAILAWDRKIFAEGEAHFLFYTGDVLHPWAFLEKGRLGARQHLAVFQFSLSPFFDQPAQQLRFARHARLLARRLASRPADEAARICICTDSPALQRWLTPALGPWLTYACPPLLSPADVANLPNARELAGRPRPCGYFGYLSLKHGWPILRQMLAAQAGRECRWLLQINPKRHPEELPDAEQTAAAAGATLQQGFFSDADYATALDQCGSLLLPYRPQQYAFLSSGKLIDALRHGCFPVVSEGTWLAEAVVQLGYGLVVAPEGWLDVPARLVALDAPALWTARLEIIREWLSRFTAPSLLDTLAQPKTLPSPRIASAV